MHANAHATSLTPSSHVRTSNAACANALGMSNSTSSPSSLGVATSACRWTRAPFCAAASTLNVARAQLTARAPRAAKAAARQSAAAHAAAAAAAATIAAAAAATARARAAKAPAILLVQEDFEAIDEVLLRPKDKQVGRQANRRSRASVGRYFGCRVSLRVRG
eukprot:6177363-Pleurochrysis_carterae.AAC.1